jgi:hypothetical protein
MPGLGFSLGLAVPPLLPTGLGVPSLALAETGDNEISYTIGQVTDANQYRVEKSTDGVTYTFLANQSTHGTYTDGGLTEGQTYYYRVRSENTLTSEVSNYRVASLALLAEFSNVSLSESNRIQDLDNIFTLTFTSDISLSASSSITLSGLSVSQTASTTSLAISGADAATFGSVGDWNNNGTLVLTVASGYTLDTASKTISFTLLNPVFPNSGVSSVTLSSSGFNTSNISGTFFNVVEQPPMFNIDEDTEANILASSVTNPSGEAQIRYGTDTKDLYVYVGSSTWYKFSENGTV